MALLITPEGVNEWLPSACLSDVLPGPTFVERVVCGADWELIWSVANYSMNAVNGAASAAAGHMIKGDALLRCCSQHVEPSHLQSLATLLRLSYNAVAKHYCEAVGASCSDNAGNPQNVLACYPRALRASAAISKAHAQAGRLVRSRNSSNGSLQRLQQGEAATGSVDDASSYDKGNNDAGTRIVGDAAAEIHCTYCHSPPAEGCGSQPFPALPCPTPGPLPPALAVPASAEGCASLKSSPRTAHEAPSAPPPWAGDLPSGVLALIATIVAAESPSAAQTFGGICTAWRSVLLASPDALRAINFNIDIQKPFKGMAAGCSLPAHAIAARLARQRLPALLMRAAAAYNVSALRSAAVLHGAAGQAPEALRCWYQLAKLGDAQAQYRYGMALYEGNQGAERDTESAQIWLSRAVKQVLRDAGCIYGNCRDDNSATTVTASSAYLSTAGTDTPAAPTAGSASTTSTTSGSSGGSPGGLRLCDVLVTDPARRELLARACTVLGYLHFDGEASSLAANRDEAVRMFRLAAAHGSTEAATSLGWMYNTGQY